MSRELSTPDLVLLSLLSEQPMHGYQANAELERRSIRDWAAISRPQVYYSLDKLARRGLLRGRDGQAGGPERQVYSTTSKGLAALSAALDREQWTSARERPPFLTWLALSWRMPPAAFQKQIARRRDFLRGELSREKSTLKDVLKEVGHPYHEAVWMITLIIAQYKTELAWLARLARQASLRKPAKHPELIAGV